MITVTPRYKLNSRTGIFLNPNVGKFGITRVFSQPDQKVRGCINLYIFCFKVFCTRNRHQAAHIMRRTIHRQYKLLTFGHN